VQFVAHASLSWHTVSQYFFIGYSAHSTAAIPLLWLSALPFTPSLVSPTPLLTSHWHSSIWLFPIVFTNSPLFFVMHLDIQLWCISSLSPSSYFLWFLLTTFLCCLYPISIRIHTPNLSLCPLPSVVSWEHDLQWPGPSWLGLWYFSLPRTWHGWVTTIVPTGCDLLAYWLTIFSQGAKLMAQPQAPHQVSCSMNQQPGHQVPGLAYKLFSVAQKNFIDKKLQM